MTEALTNIGQGNIQEVHSAKSCFFPCITGAKKNMLKHHTHFHKEPPSPKQKQTTFPELTYPTMLKKNIFKSALGWDMLVPSKVIFHPFLWSNQLSGQFDDGPNDPPRDESQSNQQWPPLRPEAWLFRQSFQRMLLEVAVRGIPQTLLSSWLGVSQKR